MKSSKPDKGPIIVFGILFWFPLAGVTYQFLHFLIGLRRLGYDPYYVEDSGRWIYDPNLNDLSPDATGNLNAVVPVREAEGFLNVTGAQEIRDEHMACRRRIYVETDPVAAQIKVAQGDKETIAALKAHDTQFSYGGNFGKSDCRVPLGDFNWLPTLQPVVLDLWQNNSFRANGAAFNTIATWHNKGKDIVYNGETYYWSKDREFKKILDLPKRRAVPFELAVGVHHKTQQLLEGNGWRVVDPIRLSSDV